jgi:hypothetical protein
MGYPGVSDLLQVAESWACHVNPAPAGVELGTWLMRTTTVELPAGYLGATRYQRRRYFLKIPTGYDHNRAYKVVITASACVGQEEAPTAIDYSAVTSVVGGVIQIAPIPLLGFNQPGELSCFDTHSTNSIEYPFLEKVLTEVGNAFCFDRNKVFVAGYDSGGWLANNLGCVYGSTRVRGISSNNGGLLQAPDQPPPCKMTPTPGLWILPTGDPTGRVQTRAAIDRALMLNKCQGAGIAGAYQTAPSDLYTLGYGVDCRKYRCPEAFPVVFCEPPGGHGPIPWEASAAWLFFDTLP